MEGNGAKGGNSGAANKREVAQLRVENEMLTTKVTELEQLQEDYEQRLADAPSQKAGGQTGKDVEELEDEV